MSKNSCLKILMAALFTALIMLSLSACSSDKDEPKENDGLVLGTFAVSENNFENDDEAENTFEKGETIEFEVDDDWGPEPDTTGAKPIPPLTNEQIELLKQKYLEFLQKSKGYFKSTSAVGNSAPTNPPVQVAAFAKTFTTEGWSNSADGNDLEVPQDRWTTIGLTYRIASLYDFDNDEDVYIIEMENIIKNEEMWSHL
jgi:hypothetical protein